MRVKVIKSGLTLNRKLLEVGSEFNIEGRLPASWVQFVRVLRDRDSSKTPISNPKDSSSAKAAIETVKLTSADGPGNGPSAPVVPAGGVTTPPATKPATDEATNGTTPSTGKGSSK